MAAVLKPSVNVLALLESDDPGDTSQAKADAAARMGGNFSKKQQPQMSPWKINKLKAEAEAAAAKQQQQQQQQLAASTNTNTDGGKNRTPQQQQQQQLAASTKTNTAGTNRRTQQLATVPSKGGHVMTTANVGKNSKPQRPALPARAQLSAAANAGMSMKPKQPSVPSRAQQVGAAANAAMNMKPKQPAAASTAQVNTAANARGNEQFRQQQQQPVEPAGGSLSLGEQLIAYANSVRTLVYKNRKQNAKDGVSVIAPTKDKKGGHTNGAAVKDAPPPVQEETPAPVQPVGTAAATELGGVGSVPVPEVELTLIAS